MKVNPVYYKKGMGEKEHYAEKKNSALLLMECFPSTTGLVRLVLQLRGAIINRITPLFTFRIYLPDVI